MICDADRHGSSQPPGAISIGLTYDSKHDSTHLGIVFNIGQKANYFHFAWHNDLRLESENLFGNYGRFVCLPVSLFESIDETFEIRRSMISMFRTLASKYGNNFPYATMYSGGFFSFSPPNNFVGNENGLTCATFVLSIFKSKDIDLLETSTWQTRASDETWREWIISMLIEHSASASHIDAVRKEKNSVRFRPEEVFVAASQASNATFSFCESGGALIKSALRGNSATDCLNQSFDTHIGRNKS